MYGERGLPKKLAASPLGQKRQRNRIVEDATIGKIHKDEKSKKPSSSCSFTLKYEELDAFQVMNGSILQYEQIATSGTISICDEFKCSSKKSGAVITSVEGQCNETRSEDYLEVNVSASKGGSINLVCPDINYIVDIVCDVYDLGSGELKLENERIDSIDRNGPLLEVQFLAETFASCSIVCEDPFHRNPAASPVATS